MASRKRPHTPSTLPRKAARVASSPAALKRQRVLEDNKVDLPPAERTPPRRSNAQHVLWRLADENGKLRPDVRRWLDGNTERVAQIQRQFVAYAARHWSALCDPELISTMSEQTLLGPPGSKYSLETTLSDLHGEPFDGLAWRCAR